MQRRSYLARGGLRALVMLFVTLMWFAPLTSTVSAAVTLPVRTSTYAVDSANVLTDATEEHIAEANAALFALTGAQIVVVTVPNTGSEKIGDFALAMFNEWGIGSVTENNGVLLVVSTDKKEYWALQGKGISDRFSSNRLTLFLNENMVPSLASDDIDTGVLKTFDAFLSHMESIYGVKTADWDGVTASFTELDTGGQADAGGASSETKTLTETVFDVVKTVFFILVGITLVVFLIAFLRALLADRERRQRIAYRQAVENPAPRTTASMSNTQGIPRPQTQQLPRQSSAHTQSIPRVPSGQTQSIPRLSSGQTQSTPRVPTGQTQSIPRRPSGQTTQSIPRVPNANGHPNNVRMPAQNTRTPNNVRMPAQPKPEKKRHGIIEGINEDEKL